MNKKIFQNLKMQDFIAGLILQQLLSILIFVFREGHEIIERGGVEKWINLAQYMQIPFWNMKGIPERMKNRLFLMCNIGISYIVLLFLDTFKKYRNRQEQ